MHTGGLGFATDNWRFNRAENPGGPLFQCGIHKIDMLRFLFGEGRWISGIVSREVTPSATDDSYILLGEFGGIPSTLHSHYVASYRHSMEIYGTKGDLFITEHPDKLEHKITDLTSGFEPTHDLTAKISNIEAESESLRDFAFAVREGRQPDMNGREGLKSLELVFQATELAVKI
jgi:predicted dehydrogenase